MSITSPKFKKGDRVRRTRQFEGYRVGDQPFRVDKVDTVGPWTNWVHDSQGGLHDPDNLELVETALTDPLAPFGSRPVRPADIFSITNAVPAPVDVVNHPPHYKSNGIEVIDIIEAFDLGPHLANVVKYVLRAGKKDEIIQELKKARWYLDRKISNLEKKA